MDNRVIEGRKMYHLDEKQNSGNYRLYIFRR